MNITVKEKIVVYTSISNQNISFVQYCCIVVRFVRLMYFIRLIKPSIMLLKLCYKPSYIPLSINIYMYVICRIYYMIKIYFETHHNFFFTSTMHLKVKSSTISGSIFTLNLRSNALQDAM